MTFPVEGAWTRQSVSINGSQHFELQRVYWLQVGQCYADLRVPFHPLGGTSCFSGRSGWVGDRFSWTHGLDLNGPGPDDIGELFWDGDHVVERGTLGHLSYEEFWMRLPDGEGDPQAFEDARACRVQVGGHAIAVADGRATGGTFDACYWVRGGDGWTIGAAIGDVANLPAP